MTVGKVKDAYVEDCHTAVTQLISNKLQLVVPCAHALMCNSPYTSFTYEGA